MIGVDANVLLRHLLRDDESQARDASAFFLARSASDPAYVSIVALIETIWTLRRRERVPASGVIAMVTRLLLAEEIIVQATDVVRRALTDATEQGTDIADALSLLADRHFGREPSHQA